MTEMVIVTQSYNYVISIFIIEHDECHDKESEEEIS